VHGARGGARVLCVALSACASQHALCAVGSDERAVRLFDLATGAAAHTLGGGGVGLDDDRAGGPGGGCGAGGGGGHQSAVLAVRWHPSHEYELASAGKDGRVLFWDVRRSGGAALLGALDAHATAARAGAATGAAPWLGPPPPQPAPSPAALASSVAHPGGANAICFLPGAHAGAALATAGLDQRIRRWGIRYVPEVREAAGSGVGGVGGGLGSGSGGGGGGAAAVEPDAADLQFGARTLRVQAANSLVSFGAAGAVRNRLPRCVQLCAAEGGDAARGGLLFYPQSGAGAGAGAGAAGAGAGAILVLDASSGAQLHALRGHHGGVLGLALSDDGDLFSSGDDGALLRWRAALLPAGGGDGEEGEEGDGGAEAAVRDFMDA
jgi:WD40 repeat protein